MITLAKETENMGGSLKVWLVPPTLVTLLQSGTLTISNTAGVYNIYVSNYKINPETPFSDDRANGKFDIKINAFHPVIRREATDLFISLMNQEFVVVFLDSNLRYNVAGNVAEPLKFKFAPVTGNDTPDLNGYAMVLYGDCQGPPLIVDYPF